MDKPKEFDYKITGTGFLYRDLLRKKLVDIVNTRSLKIENSLNSK